MKSAISLLVLCFLTVFANGSEPHPEQAIRYDGDFGVLLEFVDYSYEFVRSDKGGFGFNCNASRPDLYIPEVKSVALTCDDGIDRVLVRESENTIIFLGVRMHRDMEQR